MQREERERQYDVAQGKYRIDNAFSMFDPGYYEGYAEDYKDFYFPKVEQQYQDANSKMMAALAGKGILESTVGADALSDLYGERNETRTGIANDARDAAQSLRSNVEKTKTNLYALNESSADPQGISARARGEATSLVGKPSYSPLGQVFASALEPWISYSSAKANSPGRSYSSPYNMASGSGSGRVIG